MSFGETVVVVFDGALITSMSEKDNEEAEGVGIDM